MVINHNKLTFRDAEHFEEVLSFFMRMDDFALIYPLCISLKELGFSYAQIARKLDVSYDTVNSSIRKFNKKSAVK